MKSISSNAAKMIHALQINEKITHVQSTQGHVNYLQKT